MCLSKIFCCGTGSTSGSEATAHISQSTKSTHCQLFSCCCQLLSVVVVVNLIVTDEQGNDEPVDPKIKQ